MSRYTSRHYTLDPHDMETRFQESDGMSFMGSIFLEPSEETMEKMERIREVIETLPPTEADFIDLYFFKRCRQTSIAKIFDVSQPTVCYRLRRAAARIKYLVETPIYTEEQMCTDLKGKLKAEEDVRIMWLMYKTTCQSAAARILGVSQGKVRHRFLRSIEILKTKEGVDQYVELFMGLRSNLNILREVKRPSNGTRAPFAVI